MKKTSAEHAAAEDNSSNTARRDFVKHTLLGGGAVLMGTAASGAFADTGVGSDPARGNQASTTLTANEAAVDDLYQQYAALWFDGNPDITEALSFYGSPFRFNFLSGPASADTQSLPPLMQHGLTALKEAGWSGCKLLNKTLQELNDHTVLIQTQWLFHNAKGESVTGLEPSTWLYLVSRGEHGWKFVTEVEMPAGSQLIEWD
jgi:hypothetical protein